MNEKKKLRMGPRSRDVSDALNNIVNQVFEMAGTIVSVRCDVPDGFVRLPSTVVKKEIHIQKSKSRGDKTKAALSAVLPAGMAALALAFEAPSALVVFLTGTGGIAGNLIQNTARTDVAALSELNLPELDLVRLTSDDISTYLTVDETKKQKLAAEAGKKIDSLCAEIAEYEREMDDRHDIAVDKSFGKWVQDFLVYAGGRPDDRRLQQLRDDLIIRLASMKIRVYDEVVLNKDGKPDVPIQDYLIDSREGNDDDYQTVCKPAIYSDRSILARGEIA